jgi:hypothetical protein
MRKIYKYQLETTDIQYLKIPRIIETDTFKEQVLKIDTQNGIPCIWCLVDTEEEERNVSIRTVGTGNPMPLLSKDNYLGSYILHDGRLVFHVFL